MRGVILPCLLCLGCSGGHDDDPAALADAAPGADASSADGDADADLDAATEPDAAGDAGPPLDPGPPSSRQTARPLGTTDAAQGYWEYLPPGYDEDHPAPLLVFLHGIGENGDGSEGALQVDLANGPPMLIANDQWPNERPFLVLSPQHSSDPFCPSASEVHEFIAFAFAEYAIDPDRVYLTGLSCGGIGAWQYLGEHLDEQIVAMVPIAGDGRGAWQARGCDLGAVAIWAFHGDADPVVDPAGSTIPMEGLADCPSPPRRDARLDLYPGVGHGSWAQTYDLTAGHDIYTWMLEQVRQ